MKRIVAASGARRAVARISRNSATFDMTALMRTKRLFVSRAMASAMLVLPQPGGP